MAVNAVTEREVSDNCCSTCIICCQEFLGDCWEFCLCRDDSSDTEELPQDFEDAERVREVLEEVEDGAEETGDLDNDSDDWPDSVEADDNGYTGPRDSPSPQESTATHTVEVVVEHLAIPEPPPVQVIPATPEHKTSES